MQVPEGFYTIEPGQMNPNSHYYLAFNVGYPNVYDRAYGRTGGSVMVHGVCSSAGCFSMALAGRGHLRHRARRLPRRPARDPTAVLSVPHDAGEHGEVPARSQHRVLERTEERLRPFRGGEDRAAGFDLRQALRVRRSNGSVSASAPCPALHRDDEVEALVAEKEAKDNAKVAELAASGVKAIRTVYADGGQSPVFAGYKDTSDPDALVGGPQYIVLNDAAKPAPAAVKVAVADAARQRAAAAVLAATSPASPSTEDTKRQMKLGLDGNAGTVRLLGREHAEHEEMAASRRPGSAGPAGSHGLHPRAADPDRRSIAAAPRRFGCAGRKAAACRAEVAAAAVEAGRDIAGPGLGCRRCGARGDSRSWLWGDLSGGAVMTAQVIGAKVLAIRVAWGRVR